MIAGQLARPKVLRSVALVLVACATLAVSPLTHGAHGRTVGSAGVTSIGTASYSIPVVLPRGTNDLTPQLSLTYNHRTGSSPLGVGWSIGGLSTIARCVSTKVQDGASRDVRLDYNDQYCLDDQKLRLEAGTHGQAGAQYRTEVESFARVTAYGSAGLGPAYFLVERKDGLIYEYGNTADSRIESLGVSTARVWALNKIRDRSGNAIAFVYLEDSVNGGYRISSIDYASNPGQGVTTPPYHVNFVYENLPVGEVYARYLSGKLIKRLSRLDRIEITHDTGIVRQYELSYEPTLSNTARSRLQSIQECADDLNTCYSPTTFSYQNGIPFYQDQGSAQASIPSAHLLVIDINGDARSDVVYSSSATSGAGTWMYLLATSAGGFGTPVNSGIANTNFTEAIPIDYNADGLEDFLVPYSGGTWWVVLGSAAGLTAPFNTGIPAAGGAGNARAIDVTADGLDDLVWAQFDGMGGDAVYYRARELNGTFSSTPGYLVHPVGLDNFLQNPVFGNSQFSSRDRQPDFNGDGYADFVAKFYFFNLEVGPMQRWSEVVLGGGAGRFNVANTPDAASYPVDLNGDGYTDLAYVANGNWTYRFSQGTSFGPNVTGPSAVNYLNQNAVVVDFEGDGYEDLAARYIGAGNSYLGYLRSSGEALLSPQMMASTFHNTTHHYVGDVNGDGQSDVLALAGSTLRYLLHLGPAPDLLLSVTDGFGNQVSFDYAPLTSTSGCYSRDSAAPTFPSRAYVGPVQVVCAMTMSDGIGGSYSLSYHYSNADLHMQGRGFLGFSKRRIVDSRNNIASVEEYSTDYAAYERLGALVKATVRQSTSGPVIRETTPAWNRHIYGSGSNERRFPFVSQSVTRAYEVGGIHNGALLRTATTVNSVQSTTGTIYDSTTTTVEASTANGVQASASYSQRVHLPTAYLTDTTHWCLGRPQRMETTGSHNQFGGGAITRTVSISWDAAKCRPTEIVTEPGQGTLQVTRVLGYDDFGNLNSDTVTGGGMAARTTTIEWDASGRFTESVTNALSQTTSFDWYEATGLPMSQTDPNGLVVSWVYDPMGRRTRETRPDGTKTAWTYEACAGCAISTGRTLVTETQLDVNNAVITDRRLYADTFDRQIAVSDRSLSGAYTRIERKYDELGRVIQEGAPCWWFACTPHWTDIAYDAINRPISISRPLSDSIPTPQTTYIYHEGLTTRRVDALGKQSVHIVNAIGALARSADHTGYYQQFDHDAFGNTSRVVDSLGYTLVSNAFNVRGMRTEQTDLEAGTWTYTPNALGEVTSQTDAKEQTATFEYDLLGRLERRIEPEGTSEWIWGNSASAKNIGRLAAATGPGYSESYLYDALGRVQRRTILSDATYHVDYAYNPSGMLHTLTYPASTSGYRLQLLYEYQNGHLLSVKDANAPSTAFWTGGATDARGNIIAEALGNGMQTIRGYDSVTGFLDYLDSGSGAIQDLTYTWNAVGHLTERRDERQGLTEAFQYDDLHRLTATTGPDPIDLDYDPRGNLWSKSGNTNNVHGGVSHTVTYTSYNLPNAISRPGGDASQFFYAPDRSRWKQAATYGGTGETTVYIGNLIEKVTVGSNVLWRHYIAGATGPVAVYTRKSSGTNEMHYLTRDHLGSIDSVSNAAGAVEVRMAFGAFGQRRRESGWSGDLTTSDWTGVASTTRRGYTSHETLDNLNLTQMNGRVYDQVTGRFLSADPFVQAPGFTQSFNRYAYVFNNPLSYTDPSGYSAKYTRWEMGPGLSVEDVVVTGSRIYDPVLPDQFGSPFGSMPGDFGSPVFGDLGSGSNPLPDSLDNVIEHVVTTAQRPSRAMRTQTATANSTSQTASSSCARAAELANLLIPPPNQPKGGTVLDPVDSALTAAGGIVAGMASSTRGDAFLQMTHDAAERSLLPPRAPLATNANVFGPFGTQLTLAGLAVNAGQVALAADDGGLAGGARAAGDSLVTMGLSRLGGWGVVGALGYNAVGGSQGIQQHATTLGYTQMLEGLQMQCALGF